MLRSSVSRIFTFHISEMLLSDIPEVMAIENSTVSPWSEKLMRLELISRNGWHFVCRQCPSGKIIGFITGTLVCDEADIRKLAIGPHHRRLGAACCLLKKLFWYLEQQRAAKCFLELRDSNLVAKRLYNGLNFQETGIRKAYYTTPTEDAILMTKVL